LVRGLQHSLSLSPYEAKFRIALLLNFQRANQNAQNALLKTLEEAPQQVILLLTADSPDNVLPTISSRTEILRLRPVSMEVLEKALLTRWHIPQEQAKLVSHLSNGRAGLALQMVNDPALMEKRAAALDDLIRLLPQNTRERFASMESLSRSRDQLRLTLQLWLSFFRDMLLVSKQRSTHVTNLDRLDDLTKLADGISSARILTMIHSVDRSLEFLESNANLRLLVDNLLLEIPQLN
jgi:DNA polymerase-3 subunit delta'